MSQWETFTNQEQWKIYLKNLVKTNDKALFRAIILIYNNQTEEEKCRRESIEDNKRGFDKIDAFEMAAIANKIKNGQQLTKGELYKSRNKMTKYWKQLMIISKAKMEKEKQELERALNEVAHKAQQELMKTDNNEIIKCLKEGKSCSYGICSECPLSIRR